jgi:alpha-amylase
VVGFRNAVAINAGDGELAQTFATSLPAGTHCDVAKVAPSACAGNTVTVGDDGKAQLTLPAKGAVALRVGAKS